MKSRWTIGAQLSTSHSPRDAIRIDDMLAVVGRVRAEIPLDLLFVGAREEPDVFRAMTGAGRPVSEVFLWYNLLSDIDDMEETDLVVDWRGQPSRGWGGWAEKGGEVSETFRFVCPNNPAARAKTLHRLGALLAGHPFTGVFLDKLRFPSPANGLDEVLSCFCEHCRRAAKATGLDLDAVTGMIADRDLVVDVPASADRSGPAWLEALAGANAPLARFLRFRMDSITGLVAEAAAVATKLGRAVALDLFSPGLAALVGQDYRALARHAVWAKPMTYRVALGPAGLRLEVPALIEGVARLGGLNKTAVSSWAARHVEGFDAATLRTTRAAAVPLPIIQAEIAAAVATMAPRPVYFGLELVRHPGIIDITPAHVRDMVAAGRAANAAGVVISWDLMHAPMDGVRALAELMQPAARRIPSPRGPAQRG
jgi:hypothetical protein